MCVAGERDDTACCSHLFFLIKERKFHLPNTSVTRIPLCRITCLGKHSVAMTKTQGLEQARPNALCPGKPGSSA